MAYFFRKHDKKKRYDEIDGECIANLIPEQSVDSEIFGYIKVQLPKTRKNFIKHRSWVTRYCFLSKSELLICKNEFREYEKDSIKCQIHTAISMKVFQSVERLNKKKNGTYRWTYTPPRFVEIVDERKKKFRLSFVSDDEMNYWLGALFKAFNKTHQKLENVADFDRNEEELFHETSQPKIAPIRAPRLSKLKLLAGAMDDEKQSNQNAKYKKALEIRAIMLAERRCELVRLLNLDEISAQIHAVSENNENSLKDKSKRTDSLHSIYCESQVEFKHNHFAPNSAEFCKSDRVSAKMEPLISPTPMSVPLYPNCFTKFQKPNEFVDDSFYLWSVPSKHREKKSSFDSTKYAISSEIPNFSGKFLNRNEPNPDTNENDKEQIFVSKVEFNVSDVPSKNSTFTAKNEISAVDGVCDFKNGSDRSSPWERPKIVKPKCLSCGCDRSKSFKSQCSSKYRIGNRKFFNDSRNLSMPSVVLGNHDSDDLAIGDARTNLIDVRFRYQSSDFMKKILDVYDSKSSLVKNTNGTNLYPWLKVQGTGQFTTYNRNVLTKNLEHGKCFKLPEFECAAFRSLSHFGDQDNQKHTIACKLCRSYAKK